MSQSQLDDHHKQKNQTRATAPPQLESNPHLGKGSDDARSAVSQSRAVMANALANAQIVTPGCWLKLICLRLLLATSRRVADECTNELFQTTDVWMALCDKAPQQGHKRPTSQHAGNNTPAFTAFATKTKENHPSSPKQMNFCPPREKASSHRSLPGGADEKIEQRRHLQELERVTAETRVVEAAFIEVLRRLAQLRQENNAEMNAVANLEEEIKALERQLAVVWRVRWRLMPVAPRSAAGALRSSRLR